MPEEFPVYNWAQVSRPCPPTRHRLIRASGVCGHDQSHRSYREESRMDLWPHSQWRADCQGRIKASSRVADGLMAALPNGGLTARAESEHRYAWIYGRAPKWRTDDQRQETTRSFAWDYGRAPKWRTDDQRQVKIARMGLRPHSQMAD